MPSKPRSEVFEPDVVGVYHCWNRLVQRRHLFGWDLLTGRDYSYRKDWVRDRVIDLASSMAIDVLDYGVLTAQKGEFTSSDRIDVRVDVLRWPLGH